jgi:hypothetical protein
MARWPRALFGSAVRSWVTGAVVVSVVIAASLVVQAVMAEDAAWLDFLAFMIVWLGIVFWGGAGAVVALTTPLRRRSPSVEGIVIGLELALLATGVALWAWLLAIVPWDL